MSAARRLVDVFRGPESIVVESASVSDSGGWVANGWIEVVSLHEATDMRVGELVNMALERSGAIATEDLPAVPRGATVASEAAGFASEDAMLAAGVSSVAITLKNAQWSIIPAVNMGPGKGWSGHADAPRVRHEGEWSVEELGAGVLEALDAAELLSRV